MATEEATARIKINERLAPEFIRVVADHIATAVGSNAEGIGVRGGTRSFFAELQIPLPPLATQQAIVAEIEDEQVLVAANRELIAHVEKKIQATLSRVWGEET